MRFGTFNAVVPCCKSLQPIFGLLLYEKIAQSRHISQVLTEKMKGKNLNWEDYIMFRSCFVNPTKQAETLSKKKRCKDTFSEKLSRNGTAERKDKEVKVYEGSALTPPSLSQMQCSILNLEVRFGELKHTRNAEQLLKGIFNEIFGCKSKGLGMTFTPLTNTIKAILVIN